MTASSPRILFHVQHLLGIGHLYRARRICDALVRTGASVTLVAGGMPARALENAPFDIVQLDPVRAGDAGFSGLVDVTGAPLDEDFKTRRRDRLLTTVTRIAPDVIVTESFPFGRRQMRFELIPLLEHVSAMPTGQRPALLASVRDILQEGRKPGRDAETVDLLNRYYDAVLVHGDPSISTLADTFPDAGAIAIPIHDTGLVAPIRPSPNARHGPKAETQDHRFDTIVTAGGGAVGHDLLHAAADAAAMGGLPGPSIALVTGPNAPASLADALDGRAGRKAAVIPFIADLPAALARCGLSVSQAGYNTVADILVAGCPSVLVPFAEGGETEQRRRADALQGAGRCISINAARLTAKTLSGAAHEALRAKPRPFPARLDGARRSAELILTATGSGARHKCAFGRARYDLGRPKHEFRDRPGDLPDAWSGHYR